MTEADTAAEVLEAEPRWARARLEGDVDALAGLIHRDYAIVALDGRIVRRDEGTSSYGGERRRWGLAESGQRKGLRRRGYGGRQVDGQRHV